MKYLRLLPLFALLPACAALFGPGLTPEQKAYRNQALADKPDFTGQWESKKNKVKFDVRHRPSNWGALDVSVAAGETPPSWSFRGVGVRAPTSAAEQWKLVMSTHHPDRKPTQPGQMVSQTSRASGFVAADRNSIRFDNGDVWTRLGAVGALQLPAPGAATYDLELTGAVYKTMPVNARTANKCNKACEKDGMKCAATVVFANQCKLLSSVGRPKPRKQSVSWINPSFGKADPSSGTAELPGPGTMRRETMLVGQPLKSMSVGKRGARRKCEMACKEDWLCKGFSVEPWAGKCELFKAVTSAKKAAGWESTVAGERQLPKAPAPGHYSENVRMTDHELGVRVLPSGLIRDCEAACLGETKCKAASWARKTYECHLFSKLGTPTAAKDWVTWTRPPTPADMTVPPDQTMTSPLCADHARAFPAYALTTNPIPPGMNLKGDEWEFRYIDVQAVLKPNARPFAPPTVAKYRAIPGVAFTAAFYLRKLPSGLVHMHSWYNPEIVLKREGDRVVVGAVDKHSTWRLENLFEYVDPKTDGVWIVIRNPENGRFLTMRDDGVGLGDTPEDPMAQWRYEHMLIRGQKAEPWAALPILEPPPIVLDPVVVTKLTEWALTELVRQKQPACWKPGDNLDMKCPVGPDTNCGAFCAQSTEQCVLDVVNMVESTTSVFVNIAGAVFTGGSANVGMTAAKSAAKAAGKGAMRTALRQAMKSGSRAIQSKIRKRIGARVIRYMRTRGQSESFKKLAKGMAKNAGNSMRQSAAKSVLYNMGEFAIDESDTFAEAITPEDEKRAEDRLLEAYAAEVTARTAERLMVRVIAASDPDFLEIAAMVDPTGVMAVVDSFVKPPCAETPMPEL